MTKTIQMEVYWMISGAMTPIVIKYKVQIGYGQWDSSPGAHLTAQKNRVKVVLTIGPFPDLVLW